MSNFKQSTISRDRTPLSPMSNGVRVQRAGLRMCTTEETILERNYRPVFRSFQWRSNIDPSMILLLFIYLFILIWMKGFNRE